MTRFVRYLPTRDSFALAAAFGSFSAFVELVRAHRSSFWHGMGWAEWSSVAFGAAAYTSVILFLTELLHRSASRVFSRRTPSSKGICVCATLGALGVWIALGASSASARPLTVCATVLIVLGMGATTAALDVFWNVPVRVSATLWGMAVPSGLLALIAASHFWTFHERRPFLVLIVPLAWTAFTALAEMGVYLARRRSPGPFAGLDRCLIALACAAVPVVIMQYEPLLPQSGAEAPKRPSALLITADALRADYCALYGGSAATPALQSLAKDGVVFERGYSLSPWTIPSVVALMGSQYPRSLSGSFHKYTNVDYS
ncbi:MAG TPA: sulfatase-like hydrolase/transferase [Candidatus Hydrogenedentes bacterium]|nr:sulfatase-like hydrolase/transferase [Candidatus Hydrogenedentota bacterium]HIJ73192.1 sulfatase-like hydrolase/transferase [Candidatus Hydrogenedentota bacterium]